MDAIRGTRQFEIYLAYLTRCSTKTNATPAKQIPRKTNSSSINQPKRNATAPTQIPLNKNSSSSSDSSTKQPKRRETLTPHSETGYLYDAIKMLTHGARSFVQMLEEINNKNYKSVAEILSRHSTSQFNSADYDAMLQTWVQVAKGSEELTEVFLQRMASLTMPNMSAEHTSTLLSSLRMYIESYITGVLARQETLLLTAFDFVNQTKLTMEEHSLLENLLGINQEIHTHSFKTMNTYVILIDRLADISQTSNALVISTTEMMNRKKS
ncbi:unnamed protein product [Dicrocoelium dendriticum]|nr:unnamed protein product [Dicrocoelium dendriticum]